MCVFVDLVILGCQIAEESTHVTKDAFLSLSSSLHIKSQISQNCTPVEAKACLEKKVARFCVLMADAETVNDAYANLKDRKREYEDLLKTAIRVGEMVFVCYYYYYFDDDFEDDYENNINNNNGSNGDDNIDTFSNNNRKWTVFINGGQ